MRTVFERDGFGTDATERKRLPRPSARHLSPMVAVGAVVVVLSWAARSGGSDAVAPVIEMPSGPGFVPISAQPVRPATPLALSAPRFRLDDPEAIEAPRAEAARLDPASGRREDLLVQGGFDTIEAPYLHLTFTEASGTEPGSGLFVTLARRAADGQALAVIRTGERGVIETKFGPVETLELTLGGAGKRACTGFASLSPGALRLDGWLCAPLGQAPEPWAIICLLDRVTLSGHPSSEMEAVFVGFEARRNPDCGPHAPLASASLREIGTETGSIPSQAKRTKSGHTKK